MAWENLQLDIALDIAQHLDKGGYHQPGQDEDEHAAEPYGYGYLIVKVGESSSLVKRNRPEELLEQLAAITSSRPTGPWTAEELIHGLGWGDSRGAQVSMGMAMSELGWAKKRNWAKGGETNYVR